MESRWVHNKRDMKSRSIHCSNRWEPSKRGTKNKWKNLQKVKKSKKQWTKNWFVSYQQTTKDWERSRKFKIRKTTKWSVCSLLITKDWGRKMKRKKARAALKVPESLESQDLRRRVNTKLCLMRLKTLALTVALTLSCLNSDEQIVAERIQISFLRFI